MSELEREGRAKKKGAWAWRRLHLFSPFPSFLPDYLAAGAIGGDDKGDRHALLKGIKINAVYGSGWFISVSRPRGLQSLVFSGYQ